MDQTTTNFTYFPKKLMALKATICKATVQLSDIDRGVYGDHAVVIARHPSETDERMLIRLLAFALNVPADGDHGALEFAKDMWDAARSLPRGRHRRRGRCRRAGRWPCRWWL